MRAPLLESVRSRCVCIVQLTGIGDVVHALPIANDLKRDDPTRTILWIAEPAPVEVVRGHPSVDVAVTFDKRAGLSGVMALREALRAHDCDVTLNMQRYAKSILPTVCSGAPIRVGLPRSRTRDGVSLFNTHRLPEQPWKHTQDLILDYRAALGLPVDDPVEWKITFSDGEVTERERFFDPLGGRPVVGLVLASANPRKDWPASRYRALTDSLHARGCFIVLVGGPSPGERAVADLVLEAGHARVIDGLSDSVRRMMWMVDGVDLLISPDTGPLHVAHALDTPVIGLYGHTNPFRVGPWRRFRDLVIDRYTEPGSDPDPSGYDPKLGRMRTIEVEDVMAMVDRARDRYGVGVS